VDKAKAIEIAAAYKTPRYREIEQLDDHITGKIYAGRPSFFVDDGTPLLERRPCVRYPIVKIAIRSHGDMVLGEGKWPRIKVRKSDAISDEQRKDLESLYAEIVEVAELRSRMREQLELAMGQRSACVVACVRRGKVGVQVFAGKACTLERDANGDPVKLTVEYPYLEEFKDPRDGNKWTWRTMLYRREVDETNDNVYVPVEATQDGSARPSVVDKKKSKAHGLKFCPVEWYAFMPPGGHDDALDGVAIHQELLEDTVTLDITISQRSRAAHYAGDPQIWEAGLARDEKPAPSGRGFSGVVLDQNGKPTGYSVGGAPSTPGRKKGAGVVWSSTSDTYKVGILTLPGDALQALDDNVTDLARRIGLAMAYVDLEPQKAHSGEKSSGRALEILLKPQVEFDGRIREDFGEHGLCAVLSLILRVAHVTHNKQPGGVYLEKLAALCELIDTFERPLDGAATDAPTAADSADGEANTYGPTIWMPPALDLEWGPMFADTSADTIKDRTDAANEAVTGKLISKRTGTASVAHAFGVEDVDAELEQIAAEADDDGELPAETIDPAIEAQAQAHEAAGEPEKAAALRASAQPAKPPPGTPKAVGTGQGPPTPPNAPATPKAGAAPGASAPTAARPPKLALLKKASPTAANPSPSAHDAMGGAPAPLPGTSAMKTAAPNLHQRATSAAGVADTVYELLKDDYSEDDIDWVKAAHWEGPLMVSLDQIDFQNAEQWSATDDPDKVDDFTQKIADGHMKPIVLVNEPNDNKLRIIDGHHRALAYQKLGQPVMAYVAHVGTVGGPWEAMHSSQKSLQGGGRLTSQQKA